MRRFYVDDFFFKLNIKGRPCRFKEEIKFFNNGNGAPSSTHYLYFPSFICLQFLLVVHVNFDKGNEDFYIKK